MYSKDFTEFDQIAVEKEIEDQMERAYAISQFIRFDSNLDPDTRCPWRLHVLNEAGEKLRLNVVIPGYTPQDKVQYMVHSGRFDKYVPESVYEVEEWNWWIEKW